MTTTTTTSQGTFGTDCGCDYDIAHGCPSMSGGPCETTHGLTLHVLDGGPEAQESNMTTPTTTTPSTEHDDEDLRERADKDQWRSEGDGTQPYIPDYGK